MKKLNEKIKKFIDKHQLISGGDHILVGLSGGPDSVAMLRLLLQFQPARHVDSEEAGGPARQTQTPARQTWTDEAGGPARHVQLAEAGGDEAGGKVFNIKISAAHLNHSLRGKNSDDDEKFVKQLCKKLNINLFSSKIDVKSFAKEKKIGIEEASRILRYEYFNDVAKKIGATKIATAHTADDNIETVIMNLVRGTGLKGISGIPVKRGKIIRPLLCLSKDEILSYLKRNKFKFRIDHTNTENVFRRNLIRNKVVGVLKEINPNLPDTVLRFSSIMRQYEDFFNLQSKQFQGLITFSGSSIVLDISKEIGYFEIILMHLLHQNIVQKFGIQPIFGDLEKIISLKSKDKGSIAELSGDLKAIRESKSIVIQRINADKFDGATIQVGRTLDGDYFAFSSRLTEKKKLPKNDHFSELVDPRKIQSGLFLRPWSVGDKINPFGLSGLKKVSDLLTDEKISHSIRKKVLVLCDGKEIVWVCGIRLSDKYKITKATKKVLELKIRYKFELQ
ncbi:MAG: tRNA lysidine(34) synthetase TilS [Bacteroidetes bacterium]|nr:tRNA lysidine(34) synthetase TilS [Bacteroidota bacterium]